MKTHPANLKQDDGRERQISSPDDVARQLAILSRVSKEREIYYAAIQACGKDCKKFCIDHDAEAKVE